MPIRRMITVAFLLVGVALSQQCSTDADCDDSSPHTSDLCDGDTALCVHANVDGTCGRASDCVDGRTCTGSECVDGVCVNTVTSELCCESHVDCRDGDPCTRDVCACDDPLAPSQCACEHRPVPGCCEDDLACQDDDPCTRDVCMLDVRQCVHVLLYPNCCSTDAQCPDDGVSCTVPRCLPERTRGDRLECTVVPGDTNCCAVNQHCFDGNPCTVDRCNVSTNQCSNRFKGGIVSGGRAVTATASLCCDESTPCTSISLGGRHEDSDSEAVEGGVGKVPERQHRGTIPDLTGSSSSSGLTTNGAYCGGMVCVEGQCEFAIDGCECQTDAQCDDSMACTRDVCNSRTSTCSNTQLRADCCDDGGESQCEERRCFTAECVMNTAIGVRTCAYTAVPDCCTEDCDDSDPCTVDLCQRTTQSGPGTCLFERLPLGACCVIDADCGVTDPDDGTCVESLCSTADNTCVTQFWPGCCRNGIDSMCDDSVDCTIDACLGNECVHDTTPCSNSTTPGVVPALPAVGFDAITPNGTATQPGLVVQPVDPNTGVTTLDTNNHVRLGLGLLVETDASGRQAVFTVDTATVDWLLDPQASQVLGVPPQRLDSTRLSARLSNNATAAYLFTRVPMGGLTMRSAGVLYTVPGGAVRLTLAMADWPFADPGNRLTVALSAVMGAGEGCQCRDCDAADCCVMEEATLLQPGSDGEDSTAGSLGGSGDDTVAHMVQRRWRRGGNEVTLRALRWAAIDGETVVVDVDFDSDGDGGGGNGDGMGVVVSLPAFTDSAQYGADMAVVAAADSAACGDGASSTSPNDNDDLTPAAGPTLGGALGGADSADALSATMVGGIIGGVVVVGAVAAVVIYTGIKRRRANATRLTSGDVAGLERRRTAFAVSSLRSSSGSVSGEELGGRAPRQSVLGRGLSNPPVVAVRRETDAGEVN